VERGLQASAVGLDAAGTILEHFGAARRRKRVEQERKERGSNQGNTQSAKSLYHQSPIDFRCYLEMARFEPRPFLAQVLDLCCLA